MSVWYLFVCNILISITDTLLNVFIAIAVDNLAKAREMTAAEKEVRSVNHNVLL